MISSVVPTSSLARYARLAVWIVLALLLVPGQLAWLYLLRDGRRPAGESTLIWGQLILGAGAVGMLALLRTTPADAIRLSPRAGVAAVVGGTLLLQAAAVTLLTPVLSDDVGRYAVVFRAVFAALAVGGVALIAEALRRGGASPWHAALLGWNPLLTLEVGGTGRPAEAVGVFLLAGVLAAAAGHRFKLAAVALGVACAVKPHAALLMPFLWRQAHERRSFRAGRRVLLVFLATLLVACAAALLDPRGWVGWLAGLSASGPPAEANGLIYESFKSLFGEGDAGRQMERATDAARLLAVVVTLGMGLLLWQSRATLAEAGYWLSVMLLLFAPAVYPWHLAWVLVFVPLLRSSQGFAGLTWAATAALSYTVWREAAWRWAVPPRWLVAEYLPVLCVLAVEVLRLARVVPLGRAVQDALPAEAHATPGEHA